MPDSKMELVLKALLSALEGAAPEGVAVVRNAVLPARIPAAGLIILRDGTPGDPEVLMSPLEYCYEHEAEVEIIVDRPATVRDQIFDALKLAVGQAIAADRTLGGLCDYVNGEAPAPIMLPIDGADGWKAATVPVVLRYGSPDPLI